MNASRVNASLGKFVRETNSSGDELDTEEWPRHQGDTGLVIFLNFQIIVSKTWLNDNETFSS